MSALAIDPAAALALRLAGAALLGHAGLHKLRDPLGFRVALAGHGMLPESWLRPVGAVLGVAEVALAATLLLPSTAGAAAAASAGLLLLYTAVLVASLVRGRSGIDCGCGGPAGELPVGQGLLVRNAALVLLFAAATLPTTPRTLVWIDAATVAAGAATLALIYAGAEQLLANFARRDMEGLSWSTH